MTDLKPGDIVVRKDGEKFDAPNGKRPDARIVEVGFIYAVLESAHGRPRFHVLLEDLRLRNAPEETTVTEIKVGDTVRREGGKFYFRGRYHDTAVVDRIEGGGAWLRFPEGADTASPPREIRYLRKVEETDMDRSYEHLSKNPELDAFKRQVTEFFLQLQKEKPDPDEWCDDVWTEYITPRLGLEKPKPPARKAIIEVELSPDAEVGAYCYGSAPFAASSVRAIRLARAIGGSGREDDWTVTDVRWADAPVDEEPDF